MTEALPYPMPRGLGWAVEFVTLPTYSGTHLDAPCHYHPTMDRGKPSLRIDEIPLEWCFSEGVVLDFRRKADGKRITVEDVKKKVGPNPVPHQAPGHRGGRLR